MMTHASTAHERVATVLTIDDSQTELLLLSKILSDYKVISEPDPTQTMKHLENSHVDLILLDVYMPVMSGIEVCEQIKKDPRFSQIPILFLSGEEDVETVVAALQSGAVDFVRKPCIAQELRARVETHLRLIQLQEQIIALRELGVLQSLIVGFNHHFNNQLAVISSNARLIEADQGRLEDNIRRIDNAVGRMSRLLEELKQMKKIETEEYLSGLSMIRIKNS